jgi:hypothetical protein
MVPAMSKPISLTESVEPQQRRELSPSKDLQFEMKTGKANAADLTATIQKEIAIAEELTAKIEDLAADIATDEAELNDATATRDRRQHSQPRRKNRMKSLTCSEF